VEIWIGVALVGLIVAGITIKRLLARSSGSSDIDLGEVSQSWLTEKRTDKSDH
jgi:hypothetical protein